MHEKKYDTETEMHIILTQTEVKKISIVQVLLMFLAPYACEK